MKLFKNQITGDIFQTDNPNQSQDCIDITNTQEGMDYFLQKAKEAKIAELETYYKSEECWLFKVKSTNLNASITRNADWFAKMLPAIDGLFVLLTDAGVPVQTNLTAAQARKINAKINIEMSLAINGKKQACLAAINACKTPNDVDTIDVKIAMGEIPREVEIDNIV